MTELTLWVLALQYKKQLHDAYPDVGMGLFLPMILDQVIEESRLEVSESMKANILKEYSLRNEKRRN